VPSLRHQAGAIITIEKAPRGGETVGRRTVGLVTPGWVLLLTALGKLLTVSCICHQAVGIGVKSREGNGTLRNSCGLSSTP